MGIKPIVRGDEMTVNAVDFAGCSKTSVQQVDTIGSVAYARVHCIRSREKIE
jgi:hypothetical protein